MGFPKIVVHDRQVILLSGYRTEPRNNRINGAPAPLAIAAEDKLKRAVENNPDAVAFGYVHGDWMAGA